MPISYRSHRGKTNHSKTYGTKEGIELREGGEWTLFGVLNYSGTTFSSGETSQTTNMITIGIPFVNFKYENDYMFGLGEHIPYVPAADGGDRYRTAAARLQIGPYNAGINMFTGDPGLDSDNRLFPEINGRETYTISKNGDDPDKYRAGIFYIGFGSFRIGRNSEINRHIFQNQFAHDFMMGGESPYFRRLDELPTDDPYYTPNKWYFYFGSGSGNTLW